MSQQYREIIQARYGGDKIDTLMPRNIIEINTEQEIKKTYKLEKMYGGKFNIVSAVGSAELMMQEIC